MIKRHPLGAYFALSFALSWGIATAVIVFGEAFAARFGDIDLRAPFWKTIYHAAVYTPAVSAFLVIGVRHGGRGVRAYARRLLHWRAPLVWYGAVLLGFPVIQFAAGALANATSADPWMPLFAVKPWYHVVPLFLVSLIDGPGPMEELGWRGFALPLLQQRFSALGASLLLGVIWGVWHIPAFFIAAMPQSAFDLPVFILNATLLSVLMTAVYNSAGGSIPLAFLLHGVGNFNYGTTADPPSTQLWMTALLGAVVVGLVWTRGAAALGPQKHTAVLAGMDFDDLRSEPPTTSARERAAMEA